MRRKKLYIIQPDRIFTGGLKHEYKKRNSLLCPDFLFARRHISNQILLWEIRFFASENLGNNTTYVFTSRFLIFWGINLVLILIAGFFIFRKISKKEVFFSALIMAIIQFIFLFIIQMTSAGLVYTLFYYFSSWCSFFSELTHEMFGSEFIGCIIQCLMPFIFVLFGKKS